MAYRPDDADLPYSLEAEQALLGTMLLDAEAASGATEALHPRDFYRSAHNLIFSAIAQLVAEGLPTDTISVAERLRSTDAIEATGGDTYLLDLTSKVTISGHWRRYTDIVYRCARMRELVHAGQRIMSIGLDNPDDLDAAIAKAEEQIAAVTSDQNTTAYHHSASSLAEEAALWALERSNNPHTAGIPTGLAALDLMTDGLQPGQLIIIAARPSVGKSSFAENIATQVAAQGHHVHINELEQSKERVTQRLIAQMSLTNAQYIRAGRETPTNVTAFLNAADIFSHFPLTIDDTAAIHWKVLASRARKVFAKRTSGLLIVDYLGLVSYDGDSRPQGLGQVSRNLKSLSKELHIPVIALAQLKREQETAKRRPILSDLKDSGDIEQDADLVIFLDREDAPLSIGGRTTPPTHRAIVAKNRDGATGEIPLAFVPEWTRYFTVTQPQGEHA